MDLYSLLDTVAKIGLGAAISGAVTYQTAKLSHERELKKIGAVRRIDLLEKTSEQAEQYFQRWRSLASCLGGIYNGRNAPEIEFSSNQRKSIGERDKAFLEARDHLYQVMARLRLLGATEAADHLALIYKVIGKFRDPMILQRSTPKKEEFLEVREQVNKLITDFHNRMSKLYSSL